ncbi:MAG: ATP-binding protein [Bacteroidia bacterium]|nr:ATP-binding protein [Bacteroidia bacterium]
MAKNHPKVCLVCKKSFIARNLRGIYCSAKCKVSHSRQKKRNVTQNEGLENEHKAVELKEMMNQIKTEELRLTNLKNRITQIQSASIERKHFRKKLDTEEKILQDKRDHLARLNGTKKSNGSLAKIAFEIPSNNNDKLFYAILGGILDNRLSREAACYNFTVEIKDIDTRLAEIRKKKAYQLMSLDEFMIGGYQQKAELMGKKIEQLKLEYNELEEKMKKKKNIKDLNQLKDDDGFISAKDVKNISFADRILLDGDIGLFMGALEKDKCAITLTGKQGSGKTFFCFDLISKFIEKAFRVAYFSCEEGITGLTREKLIHYQLDNAENLKIKEQANLQDIERAANNFDVIVIDSWGKLNADISEFDRLRLSFPKTIIVAIFQLTSSGQMRGGTMAGYDAGINIETSIEQGKRIAVCKKNRYGKTGVKYFIDSMLVEKEEHNI